MRQPYVWVIEQRQDDGRWLPCCECHLTRKETELALPYWRKDTDSAYRVAKYVRDSK